MQSASPLSSFSSFPPLLGNKDLQVALQGGFSISGIYSGAM